MMVLSFCDIFWWFYLIVTYSDGFVFLWHIHSFILHFVLWQVDEMYREAPIKNSNFDYIEFTRILKHGKKDTDDN